MKNLHLQPMNSTFDDELVTELNANFPHEDNLFVQEEEREKLKNVDNCIVAPEMLKPQYINEHCDEYKHIFLHSLYLSPDEILQLTDAAASKIIWCVWGHDLYTVPKKKHYTFKNIVHEAIHFCKMVFHGTHIKIHRKKMRVREKVSKFHCIGIGYSYDEKMIRKKYGKKVRVVYGPYFTKATEDNIMRLREEHMNKPAGPVNILIGHCGFEFLEHEKYLKLLSKYKNENIHINMVLSYGASQERVKYLCEMAEVIYGKEKCTFLTDMMPRAEYYDFIKNMDIAVFPFKHQSALGNTKRLLFMGTKMYFHPKGVLYKGFTEGGVKIYDCRDIGKVSFAELCRNTEIADVNAPLFDTFNYKKNVEAWKKLLQ